MRASDLQKAAAWVCLGLLLIAAQRLMGRLPVTNEGLAAEKYAGWSGVLRVWVCGGWPPGGGSFIPWLNACAVKYEKARPGVYVQAISVSEATLVEFARDPILAPDAILFAPGMLKSARDLLALNDPPVRADVAACGLIGETRYAVPVAMGGYGWALNRDLLGGVPADFAKADDLPAARRQNRYLLNVPAAEPRRDWERAVESLLAGGGLPRLLPDGYGQSSAVLNDFTGGVSAVIPVTQREIRRLQILTDAGRAPDWSVEGRCGYTDQLLLCALPDVRRPDAVQRGELIAQWLGHLLSASSQQSLAVIRALRVTEGEPLYANQRGMRELEEAALETLGVPPAFGR